jgi:hypothetical protein
MKKIKITRALCIFMVFTMLFSQTALHVRAAASDVDEFLLPIGTTQINAASAVPTERLCSELLNELLQYSEMVAPNSEGRARGLAMEYISLANRISAMADEGWILESINIIPVDAEGEGIVAFSSPTVVRSEIMEFTFRQPIRVSREPVNRVLNAASRLNNPIMVIAGQHRWSWIPALFGIDVNTLTGLLSTGNISRETVSTVIIREAWIETSDQPGWFFSRGMSDRYLVETVKTISGFDNRNHPFIQIGRGSADNRGHFFDNPRAIMSQATLTALGNAPPLWDHASRSVLIDRWH